MTKQKRGKANPSNQPVDAVTLQLLTVAEDLHKARELKRPAQVKERQLKIRALANDLWRNLKTEARQRVRTHGRAVVESFRARLESPSRLYPKSEEVLREIAVGWKDSRDPCHARYSARFLEQQQDNERKMRLARSKLRRSALFAAMINELSEGILGQSVRSAVKTPSPGVYSAKS